MKSVMGYVRFIRILGNIFMLAGTAAVFFTIFKYKVGNLIGVGLVVANSVLIAVGVIAVLVARCLKDLEERLAKIEKSR
jgi:uncharacterized membrane protein